MKFCPNCGTSTEGAGKFCSQCGFKLAVDAPVQAPVAPVAPPVQQYAPPAPVAPPVQEPVAPPVQQYAPPAPVAPPVQEPVAPPVQQYAPPAPVAPPVHEPVAPPVQKPVAPPAPVAPPVQEPVAPPVQKPVVPPAPPVQPYMPQQTYAPQAPAKPATKKSKLPLFIGIGVAVVLIVLAIIFIPKLFGGASVEGVYKGVSLSMMGMELSGDDLAEMGTTQMELKSGGKCTMILMDEKVDGTWELDDDEITFELDGVTATGTLKDGKLTMTVSEEGVEMEIVFQKDGSSSKGNKGDKAPKPAATPVGQYEMTYFSVMGTELSGSDLASAGESWLKIEEDGVCTLMLMDDEIAGTYTISGDELSFDLEGIAGTGIWDADTQELELTVTNEGIDMIMSFVKNDNAASSPTATSNAAWWEGDWYGWWIISDGDGFYEDLIDSYWDTAATIEVNGDGGTITIWDEDTSKGDPLGEVTFEFTDGFGDHGALVSTGGSFSGVDINYYDWLIDSDGDAVSTLDNMICIEGTCTDSDGESFSYYIFLRPWGTEWDDVADADTSSCPYEDMMPALYEDWYLPLLEEGATSAPKSFD